MARPIKDGVDYFPMDTGFFSDDKVRLLRAEFGAKGMYILNYILCDIYYQNGYFMKWDKNRCFLVSDGAGCGCNPEFLQEFITGCLRCSFFDERVFNVFRILTSAGIQRRYLRMLKNRDEIVIIKEYWLLDSSSKKDVPGGVLNKLTFKNLKSSDNPDKSSGNPDKSSGNQQSKVNESKKSDISDYALQIIGKAFEESFGKLIGGMDRMNLIEMSNNYSVDLILEAIKIGKKNNASSAAYIISILKRWKGIGINSKEDLNKSKIATRTQKQSKSSKVDYTDPNLYKNIEESDDI